VMRGEIGILDKRSLLLALLGAAAIGPIAAAAPSAAEPRRRYTYRVHDATYGAIGTYSYDVDKSGAATTITMEARIRVSFLGIVLYRQDVSRVERLVGDRVVYFRGITKENGHAVEVNGWAEGEQFIIVSPTGRVAAPATIRSASPWSAGAPGGDIVFLPDTGRVVKVRTSGEETSITIDGTSKHVRRHQIDTLDGSERYEVWMDEYRTPVMFNIQDRDGTVKFTLVR
jgi:hypothetical protein